MDAFTLLGLETGADEAAIKRAYAQRLRSTRPDDDPTGFQQLNEAYRAALARAKANAQRAANAWNRAAPMQVHFQPGEQRPAVVPAPSRDAAARPAPAQPLRVIPIESTPVVPRPVTQAFDADAFVKEFRQRCTDGNPQALEQWLSTHPAFWHLPAKFAAGRYLLRALFDHPGPMNAASFDVCAGFFNFGDALNGIDPLLLHRVRQRGTMSALVRDNAYRELARGIYGSDTVQGTSKVRAAVRLTRPPFSWWRALLNSLIPDNHLKHTAKVLLGLCGGYLADLPAPLDKEHARFWIEAAAPGLGKSKLWVYAARSVAALAFAPVVPALLAAMVLANANAPSLFASVLETTGIVLSVTLAFVVVIWGFIGGQWLDHKLDATAASSPRLRIAMFSMTPALCAVALLLTAAVDPSIGATVAIAAMFLALWRNGAKHGGRRNSVVVRLQVYGMFILVAGAMSGIGQLMNGTVKSGWAGHLLPTLIIIAITLGIWAWDWRKRGFLTPRPAQVAKRR